MCGDKLDYDFIMPKKTTLRLTILIHVTLKKKKKNITSTGSLQGGGMNGTTTACYKALKGVRSYTSEFIVCRCEEKAKSGLGEIGK